MACFPDYDCLVFFRRVCKTAAEFCQSSGHDITDLAVLWTLALAEVPTTLISTASRVNMEKNLALARHRVCLLYTSPSPRD